MMQCIEYEHYQSNINNRTIFTTTDPIDGHGSKDGNEPMDENKVGDEPMDEHIDVVDVTKLGSNCNLCHFTTSIPNDSIISPISTEMFYMQLGL